MKENKKHINLSFNSKDDLEKIANLGHSLSKIERVKVLESLLYQSKTAQELSKELNISITNIVRYTEDLANAGLIQIQYKPSKKNKIKFFALKSLSFLVDMDPKMNLIESNQEFIVDMNIGQYNTCNINGPLGMVDDTRQLEEVNSKNMFFLPARAKANLIWFNTGFLGYDFPLPNMEKIEEISFSFEVCSEAAGYNSNWPSDITIRIENEEIATFTIPGDFGGTRGKYTPEFWPIYCTQYGQLKKITINNKGVFVDSVLVNNNININNFNFNTKLFFEIGIKEDAINCGGINLFGEKFGDYNQGILMKIKGKY